MKILEISLPADCGNAPRMVIVGDFVANWAKGNAAAVAEWLSDDISWTVVGDDTHTGSYSSLETTPPIHAERVEVLSIMTHGRLASCDGYLEAKKTRTYFSHVFRFASTAKTAKIAELRSYLITMP